MRAYRPNSAVCRVAVAVAALYALVLQAVFGSIVHTAALDPTHVLCIVEAGAEESPSKQHPAQGHLPCCTAAQALETTSPPFPASVVVDRPEPRAAVVDWPFDTVAAPRAPPGVNSGARAPPVV